jgi:hypothetical protein
VYKTWDQSYYQGYYLTTCRRVGLNLVSVKNVVLLLPAQRPLLQEILMTLWLHVLIAPPNNVIAYVYIHTWT